MDNKGHLVWIDLEMTGLDPETCTILEIATIITNSELEVLEEGPVLAIATEQRWLDAMDDWNVRHHTDSGLLERVKNSRVTLEQAQARTLSFIKGYVNRREAPLCGNSIGQDRRFLHRYMPELNEWLHYRNVDVSTIKELVRRWYPEGYQAPPKKNAHLALDDIRESIEELRHYRARVFLAPDAG
jgi:oligoribonuclease